MGYGVVLGCMQVIWPLTIMFALLLSVIAVFIVYYQRQDHANLLGFQELIRSSWRYKSPNIRTCRQLSTFNNICTMLFKLLSIRYPKSLALRSCSKLSDKYSTRRT